MRPVPPHVPQPTSPSDHLVHMHGTFPVPSQVAHSGLGPSSWSTAASDILLQNQAAPISTPRVLATLESAPPPYAPMAYPPMANPRAEWVATSLSSFLSRRTPTTFLGRLVPSLVLPPRRIPSVPLHAHVHVVSIPSVSFPAFLNDRVPLLRTSSSRASFVCGGLFHLCEMDWTTWKASWTDHVLPAIGHASTPKTRRGRGDLMGKGGRSSTGIGVSRTGRERPGGAIPAEE
eukprot:scaffold1821_cov344-Pavlova_lutheri.AAC.28